MIKSGSIEPGILYIDHRESQAMIDSISQLCPIPIDIRQLESGDYLCEDVVVERKGNMDDFCASIIDKRLWEQRERMAKDFPHHYILVAGRLEDRTIKINTHAVLGALARIMANGTKVCFGLSNDEDLSYLLLKIFEKHKKLRVIPLKKSKKKKRKNKPKKETEVYIGFAD